jgi:hypothetical protein
MQNLKIEAPDGSIAADMNGVKRARLVRWKPAVILLGVTVSTLSGVSSALATTAIGNQNPDFTVQVSLASRGTPDPDVAADGDTVDAVLSVRNNKHWSYPFRADEVKLSLTLETPLGVSATVSFTVYLFPGTRVTLPFSYTVREYFPKGPYAVTLEAVEVRDPGAPPSSATATITLVEEEY